MVKEIELIFVESGVKAIAKLLENQSPNTCEVLWNALKEPMEVRAIHDMFYGQVVQLLIPPERRTFKCEIYPSMYELLAKDTRRRNLMPGEEIIPMGPKDTLSWAKENLIPIEGVTCHPIPGDLLFGYDPPKSIAGLTEEICAIYAVYGRAVRFFGPTRWQARNMIGPITINFKKFADECKNILTKGEQKIILKRRIE